MTVLLLAWLDRHPRNLKRAVEKAVAALQGVLQATARAAGEAAFTKERDAKVTLACMHCAWCTRAELCMHACRRTEDGEMVWQVARARELRLVQNQHLLRDAPVQLTAEPLEG